MGKARLKKMKCKQIRELLLTDYSDGELEVRLKNKVEQHLGECPECKQFEHRLIKTVIEPFKNVIKTEPRDSVWNRISEAMVFEQREKPDGFLDKIQALLLPLSAVPRTAYILATVITVIFMLTITKIKFQSNTQRVAVHLQEEIEYLDYLMGDAEYYATEENGGYSTIIEEYFL